MIAGCARIGIEAGELISWTKYKHVCKIPRKELNTWENILNGVSNTSDFFCKLKPVPASQWKSVQVWNGKEWIDYSFSLEENLIRPVVKNNVIDFEEY